MAKRLTYTVDTTTLPSELQVRKTERLIQQIHQAIELGYLVAMVGKPYPHQPAIREAEFEVVDDTKKIGHTPRLEHS